MSDPNHGHDHGHHDDGEVHVHVHSMQFYVGVFLALVALTVVTVLTAQIDIDGTILPGTPHGAGGFNLALAMVIATCKATLVCLFFMHLREDSRFNGLFLIGSVLCAFIFFAYTINDTAYRGMNDPYNGVHVRPDNGERAPGGITRQIAGEEPHPGVERTETAPPAEGEHGAAEHGGAAH